MTIDQREQATLLAVTEAASARKIASYTVADVVEFARSATSVAQGRVELYDERELTIVRALADELAPSMMIAGPRISLMC